MPFFVQALWPNQAFGLEFIRIHIDGLLSTESFLLLTRQRLEDLLGDDHLETDEISLFRAGSLSILHSHVYSAPPLFFMTKTDSISPFACFLLSIHQFLNGVSGTGAMRLR